MSRNFETVEGQVMNYGSLSPATWGVIGVELKGSADGDPIDAFACSRQILGKHIYPKVLRLAAFTNEDFVRDYVWRGPQNVVETHTVPRRIEDIYYEFRGEPHPWETRGDEKGALFARGLYRAIASGNSFDTGNDVFRVQRRLGIEDLGTPPTYPRV